MTKIMRWWILLLTAMATTAVLWWYRARIMTIRSFTTIRYQDQTFNVVVAQTPAQITQGLSDREEIGAQGMLFILPQAGRPQFWMFRMQFALDFIWISHDKVVDLHQHISFPTPQTPMDAIARVQPREPVTHVLEVPAGFITQHGITMGDTLTINPRHHFAMW